MKFDIYSFSRAFPCREYQMLVKFASIRRFTVVEWIVMNAAKQAQTNKDLATYSIEKLFASVYRISKCESLVRTSVYELRGRNLITINDFDEFKVASIRFGDIHLTEFGEEAIKNSFIPSESQTRDEVLYHNLSLDLFRTHIKKNDDANIVTEKADDSIPDIFPRELLLTAINSGKLLDSKYASQQYVVEDLDLVERNELSEKMDIDISIEDGEIVCDYIASPIIRAMVKEELSNSLALPEAYSEFDENSITIRNIALGDEVFELLNAYINDEKNEALFSSVEVYKAFKKNFKKLPSRKIWFVFDPSKKSIEIASLSSGDTLTIYIPRKMADSATIVGSTSTQHIVAKKYCLPFADEKTDCILSVKEKADESIYMNSLKAIIDELANHTPSVLALYALPVLNEDVYGKLQNLWSNTDSFKDKLTDIALVCSEFKKINVPMERPLEFIQKLIAEHPIASLEEAQATAKLIQNAFPFDKVRKVGLGMCILANSTYPMTYSIISDYLETLVGTVAINDESFLVLEKYADTLYSQSILTELFGSLGTPDFDFGTPWSKYEVARLQLIFAMDRVRKLIPSLNWYEYSDNINLFNAVFESEDPKVLIENILSLHTICNNIDSFGEFKLSSCENLEPLLKNFNALFKVAEHFASADASALRTIYVIDTCSLLHHTDLLDYFTTKESIIIPAIVESELGAKKDKDDGSARIAIRSIENHRLANDKFGYERCRIEIAHMELISSDDFFTRKNDPRIISVARYYLPFNPTIITDDADMRNLASALKIKSISSDDFLKDHTVALTVAPKAVDVNKPATTVDTPNEPAAIVDPIEEFLSSPVYKLAKRFGITAEEISLLSSNKVKTYNDFFNADDEFLRGLFRKKPFLANHLFEGRKKAKKAFEKLKEDAKPVNSEEHVESASVEPQISVEIIANDSRTEESAPVATIEAIDDIASKNNEAAGFMKDVLIINVFDHHFSVTEKIQDKKIFRDFLALGLGIGNVFRDLDEARAFAKQVCEIGQYRSIVEVDYADFLKDQGFNMWVITLKKFRDRYSVFLTFKDEQLTREQILERAQYGKRFKNSEKAMDYAEGIVSQLNTIFDNNESCVIEETVVEVDVKTDILYDNDDEPLYLCKNDSKQVIWRDSELQYQFIDVIRYQAALEEIALLRQSPEFSFEDSGVRSAFDFASEASLPGLHNEIFKAEEFLEILSEDTERNQCDIEFYTSYIKVLKECVELQKKFPLPDDFKISMLVFDPSGKTKPAECHHVKIPAGGSALDFNGEYSLLYDIDVFTELEPFIEAVSDDPYQMVCAVFGSKSFVDETYLSTQVAIYEKAKQTLFTGNEFKEIIKQLKRYVRLSVTPSVTMVEDEWLEPYSTDDRSNMEILTADEEDTVELTDAVIDSVEVIEEEPIEEPPIVWSDDDTLYIYKVPPMCEKNGHDVIQVTATMIGFNEREIKMNVSYCKQCGRFFMSYTTYELYRNRYGVILGNLQLESNSDGKADRGDMVLAEASPLKLCGYSVNQTDGYTTLQRQYIISSIISRGIMTKGEVIRYLEYFININGRRSGNELALSKWKSDLEFTLQFDASNQDVVRIGRVTGVR